jgi:hypothetical protein
MKPIMFNFIFAFSYTGTELKSLETHFFFISPLLCNRNFCVCIFGEEHPFCYYFGVCIHKDFHSLKKKKCLGSTTREKCYSPAHHFAHKNAVHAHARAIFIQPCSGAIFWASGSKFGGGAVANFIHPNKLTMTVTVTVAVMY